MTTLNSEPNIPPLFSIDKVHIGPYEYELQFVLDLVKDGHTLYGHYDTGETPGIQVDPKYPPRRIVAALVHEILHCVSNEFAINLNERQVTVMATALVDTYVRNQNLFDEMRSFLLNPPVNLKEIVYNNFTQNLREAEND